MFLFFGGALITFGANAFNQIMEVKQDSLMQRTQKRPLVQSELSVTQASVIASVCVLLGFLFLYFGTTPIAGVLGLLSFILYAFVYTPSKSVTNFNVLIGAIPGALPPLIGYLAAKPHLDLLAIYLFTFQFIWQFPHFWAIAWMIDDDYQKVGYKMLPTNKGKVKSTSLIILVYTIITVLIACLPKITGVMNYYSLIIVILSGIYFIWKAFLLFKQQSNVAARRLMLASLLFMPLVYIVLLF